MNKRVAVFLAVVAIAMSAAAAQVTGDADGASASDSACCVATSQQAAR